MNSELISINASHSYYIQRLAAQLGNESQPYIDTMVSQISVRLERETGKNLTPHRREKLLEDIDAIVLENLTAYTHHMESQNKELSEYEAEWQAKTLAAHYEKIETVVVAKGLLHDSGKNTLIKLGDGSYTTYTAMLSNYSKQNAEQITNIIANGYQSGVSTREIAKQVMQEVDNRSVKSFKQAKNLAKAGTNHYANQARKVYFDAEDYVIGTRRIATLDSVTSGYCRSIDNTVVKKTDPKYNKAFGPFHYGCRTANTPEVDARLKGSTDKDTRGSNFRDAESDLLQPKQVSSQNIYYEELSTLDKKSQDMVLGSTLGKAFRKGLDDGSLTPKSFAKMTIDSIEQRPLTRKEMKKKDNALADLLNGK